LEDLLRSSVDTSYVLDEASLSLELNGLHLHVKKMNIRGESSLDYPRKSFSVKLEFPVFLPDRDGMAYYELRSFKLISLCMDYTYINNRLSFGLMEQAGLMPLYYKFVSLQLNGISQGVYMLIEDPELHALQEGSPFIMRRHYHHQIRAYEYDSESAVHSEDAYKAWFTETYAKLPEYHGEDLFNFLNQRIDLDQYFRKMALDYLLKNGDSTDEVYFYDRDEGEHIVFGVIPWDYDDIFSTQPHEVGREWAIGKVFGARRYQSHRDVLDQIRDKLIYSIEDDLDYIIATDSVLYARYMAAVRSLLLELGNEDVLEVMEQTQRELAPFYADDQVIFQSQYDQKATDRKKWKSNMEEKSSFLIERLEHMKDKLNLNNQ